MSWFAQVRARWRVWRADQAAENLEFTFTCLYLFLRKIHRAPQHEYEIPALRRRDLVEAAEFHRFMLRRRLF